MTSRNKIRIYKNPPIEEALVEFCMAPDQGWDLTIPGKLHEKVKDDYPGKPRQQKVLQTTFQAVQGQPTGFEVQEGIGRVQLVDSDAKRLLSLGPGVLSVNVLRPYEGWSTFQQRIASALQAYAEVSGARKVGRIGVRYINRFTLAAKYADLRERFTYVPALPNSLPTLVAGFMNRDEYVYEDGVKLIVTLASIGGVDDAPGVLLDLDVIWEGPEALPIDVALDKVSDLHEREGHAFEALITNKTREMLNG